MSHGAALAAGARLETCAAAATRGFTVAAAGPGGKPASDARAVEQCTLAGVEQVRDPLSIGHIWPMCACDGWATRPLVVARREGCASKWPQRARDHRSRLVTCGNHAVVAEVGRMASATMGGVLPKTRRYRAKGGMTEPHLYEVGASAAGRGPPQAVPHRPGSGGRSCARAQCVSCWRGERTAPDPQGVVGHRDDVRVSARAPSRSRLRRTCRRAHTGTPRAHVDTPRASAGVCAHRNAGPRRPGPRADAAVYFTILFCTSCM